MQNIYGGTTLKHCFKIGGRIINNLSYANDTVFTAENANDMQTLMKTKEQ